MTDSIEPVCLMIPWKASVEHAPDLRFDIALAHLVNEAIRNGHTGTAIIKALQYRAGCVDRQIAQEHRLLRGDVEGFDDMVKGWPS